MGGGSSKLPETGEIPAGIDAALFQQLPTEIQAKVTEQYKEYKSQYDELQSSYDRLRVDSEQRYFELERNYVASNERLEVETRSATQLRQTVDSLEQKVKDSTAQTEDLQRKKDEAESIMRDLESTRCSVEVDKNDLMQALESKNHEVDRLNEEWKEMSTKLAKANKERVEALAQKDQVDTQIVSIQYREQRLKQENGLLQQQNEWFDQELKAKVNELLNLRKDQSSRMLEMEAGLEQRSEENVHMEEMVKSLKETIEEQAKKIENYCEKLRESRELQAQQEEQHRGQVHSQTKLITLYQNASSDAEAQVKELSSAVSELQKLLKDASEAYTGLEKEKQALIDQHVDTINDKDAHIDRMEKELQHANELLEVARKKGTVSLTDDAIEALSPSAAAASRLLKSGMTLTQIYSEYVKSSEELLIERQENERLQQYLDKILEEIEEKAPLMKKQREDYEKSITVIDQLTRQLDTARCEEEKLRVDSDDSRRKVMHFTRENQRMKQQTLDLGQQVRMLLKELEEARGTVVSHDMSMDADVSVAEVSSSSQVISEKLVTFRGIEELQKKNQELIAALRNLSDEREELEKTAMDARTAELKRQVEMMSEELAMLQAARDRQATMVESLVRQRDMYRVLLSESGSMPLPATPNPQTSTPRPAQPESPVKPAPSTATPNRQSELLAEKTAALKELMEEFNQYREEKNKNEKMLTEQMEGFRKDVSDQRVQNARLASQLDFAGERTKVLQNNAESYKKEIAALRDKNQKYSASIIRHEQTINSLKEDLLGVKERLSRAEVIADNLRVERNMLKSIESRLVQEKENAQREQSSQKLLLANLQAIQNNLERADFENKTRLMQRIEILEKENAGLKSKLDGIDSQHRGIVATLERQLAEVQNESARRFQAAQSAKEHQDAAEKRAMELQKEVTEKLTELQTVKAQAAEATPLVQTESTQQSRNILEDEVKHFRNQSEADKAEINSLKSQLEQSRQHSEQFKTMATSLEQTLKEDRETNLQFRESAEAQLKEAREGYERLEKQLTEVEKERQNLINMNFSLTENYHKTNAGLQKQLQILQSELEEAVTLRETAIANEQAARSDHSNQATLAQEAQEKYERELILHAADVEALTNVKQQLEGFNNRLSKSEDEARDAKVALDASKSGWGEQEKLFKDEETKLKARIVDLQEQNRMLHEEMEAMSEQVMSMQHRHEQEQEETAVLATQVTSDTTTERSTDQLVEVIRFLRKEKEIAEARLEVTQAETTRVKQRAEYLERQLEESNRSLTEERQNTQVNLATAAQQMELMRKVDNLNLVTESNKLLRGERDQLMTQLRETETKNMKLEDQITPLQTCQREIKAECDALATERTALTAEVERWRARTNHLIEQCNKTDPEEHKLLLTEREILRKQVASMTEEAQKQRADISKLNANIVRLEGELKTHKEHVEESRKAQLKLNTQLAEKTKESDDKVGVITQLRKVGRKYKLQVEQVTAERNQLKAELEAGVGGNIAALEEKVKKAESELAAVSEKLGSADFEKNEAIKALKEAENQCKAVQEALDKANEEVKRLSENDTKLETTSKSLQEQVAKNAEDLRKLKESETKNLQLRNLLANSKTKMIAQKAEIEKLTAEVTELKQKVATQQQTIGTLQQALAEANAKKAAYESRISALERELTTVKNSLATAQTDGQQVTQLQQKITMLQKQLESQPKSQQAATPKPTVSASPVASHRHTGPKANITPMATVSVQPFPVQPVRRTVAPTPPTATVMPTSISAPEGEMASPSSQVRPTPPVQTVSPHIESDTQASTEPEEIEAVDTPQDPTPSTSTGRETGSAGPPSGSAGPTSGSAGPSSAAHGAAKRTREGTDGSDNDQEGPVKRPKTQVTQVQERTEPDVSASVQEVTALEPEVETEERAESPFPREVGVVEPATQQPAPTQSTPTQSAPTQPAPTQSAPTQSAPTQQQESAPSTSAEQKAVVVAAAVTPAAAATPSAQQENKSADESVIVLDDDDDEDEEQEGEEGEVKGGEEYNEEYDEEDEEGEYDEEEEEEGDEDEEDEPLDEDQEEEEGYEVQEEEFQNEDDEEGEVMEEDYNSEAEMSEDDADDNQEIVIVDDDDDESNETPMESQEEEQPQIIDQPMGTQETTQVAPRRRVPSMQPRAEPSPSTSRAQQLQPFLLATQVSQFEEGDDSIVPSTPTLVIPKGTDQVAISSPQVPQGRFLFGSGLAQESSGTSQSDLAQLASQGGVDDTRMDLSQFDDAAGRSMPTTPRSRTPPTISITEAPPRDDETDSAAADVAADSNQQSTTSMQEGRATPVESGDGENAAESADIDLTEEPKSAGRAETPTPSTSQEGHMEEGQGEASQPEESESQDDKTGPSSSEQTDSPAAAAKPKKIQRIVWDQPSARRPSRGPRGARSMPSTRGQPIQRITGAGNFGQQQQQQPGMFRGSMQQGRAGRARPQRSRRSRPF